MPSAPHVSQRYDHSLSSTLGVTLQPVSLGYDTDNAWHDYTLNFMAGTSSPHLDDNIRIRSAVRHLVLAFANFLTVRIIASVNRFPRRRQTGLRAGSG